MGLCTAPYVLCTFLVAHEVLVLAVLLAHTGHGQGSLSECHSSCHFGWETLLKALPHLTGVLPKGVLSRGGRCHLPPMAPGPLWTLWSCLHPHFPSPAGFTQLGTCRRPWGTTAGISTAPRNPDSPDPMWMASCLQRLWLFWTPWSTGCMCSFPCSLTSSQRQM